MSVASVASRSAGLRVARRLDLRKAFFLAVTALGLQLALPLLAVPLRALNLPLLAAVYLVLAYSSVPLGMVLAMLVGWAQDGLTHGPIGVYGAAYLCVGYLTAVGCQYFKVEMAPVLGALTAAAYLLHELLLFLIRVFLMGQAVTPEVGTWVALAALHAGLALLVYPLGDKLKSVR